MPNKCSIHLLRAITWDLSVKGEGRISVGYTFCREPQNCKKLGRALHVMHDVTLLSQKCLQLRIIPVRDLQLLLL